MSNKQTTQPTSSKQDTPAAIERSEMSERTYFRHGMKKIGPNRYKWTDTPLSLATEAMLATAKPKADTNEENLTKKKETKADDSAKKAKIEARVDEDENEYVLVDDEGKDDDDEYVLV